MNAIVVAIVDAMSDRSFACANFRWLNLWIANAPAADEAAVRIAIHPGPWTINNAAQANREIALVRMMRLVIDALFVSAGMGLYLGFVAIRVVAHYPILAPQQLFALVNRIESAQATQSVSPSILRDSMFRSKWLKPSIEGDAKQLALSPAELAIAQRLRAARILH